MANLTKRIAAALLFLALAFLPASAHAQFDVNASLYGQFSGTTTSNGISQSPENSAGVMAGIRRYERPWRGYEVTYSFNHANYDFSGTTVRSVEANAHSVTADYVVSLPIPGLGIRPFLLGGGGLVIFAPQGMTAPQGAPAASLDTKALFSYGGGVDIRLVPHLGLRVQYRGLLYSAPEFGNAFASTSSFTRTAEPMAGLYLRF
jgi:opacity protein-like surface antigen